MTIQELYKLFAKHYLVDIDTRSIRQNSLFFAITGSNFNGNTFAEQALKNGAIYAIIDDPSYHTDERMILVDNALTCLQELASYHRTVLGLPLIALTGSNGKTTTKELISNVLSKKYRIRSTFGNLNNHIGVPLTLLSMTPDTEIGIVEMGANHIGEIEFLCNIAKPNFGYITNFGKAHLEGFGSEEGIIIGKSELYKHLSNHQGIAFINPDDPIQIEKTKGIDTIDFEKSIIFESASPLVALHYQDLRIQSQLIGAYNFNNIQAAITMGSYFEVDTEAIVGAIENYIPSNNRSQIIEKKGSKIILDAYNANPSSMELALKSFNQLESAYKIVILGDMFELGENTAKEHQHIASLTETMDLKHIFLIGEAFSKTETKKALKFECFNEFIDFYKSESFPNATLLIKGSRGMALERVLEYF